jgi:hypothetical protein
MPVLPRDAADLYLAPLLLVLSERLEELARLELDELHVHVGLVSDLPDWSREIRETGLLLAVSHTIDCHDWTLSWHPRGLRVGHGKHEVVLGTPATFEEYLAGAHQTRAARGSAHS